MSDFWSGWVDAHCHMADPRIENVDTLIRESRVQGFTGFVMAGVDPEDWQRQLALAERHPQLLPVLGLHPYFVADHELNECETALDQLARLIPRTPSFVGEMGLDFRPLICKDSEARQIEIFSAQLELAALAQRPVVLHLVRAFDEAERIFQMFGAPARGGFVHAFNGSRRQASVYLEFGLHLSVGGALVRPDNLKLRQAIEVIPLNRLLLESDAPDQAPVGWDKELNEPGSILQVAQIVAELKGVTRDEVLATAKANLQRLIEGNSDSDNGHGHGNGNSHVNPI